MRRVPLVVVGAGPGGCAAAVQAARLGVTPILIDRAGRAGGLLENARCIENYPGLEGPVTGAIFAKRLDAHLARFGVAIEKGEVDRIEALEAGSSAEGYRLRGSFGEIAARCVIAAVGTQPLTLGLPAEEELLGKLLFYEVRHLLPRLPRRVVVIGGGEAAFDYALSLAESGTEVTVCIRSSRPAARGRLVEQVAADSRIRVESNCELAGVEEGTRGAVVALRSRQETQTLEVDAVLVAIGRRRALDALVQAPTEAPQYHVVGDARLGVLGQAGIAVGDGLWAAAKAVEWLAF